MKDQISLVGRAFRSPDALRKKASQEDIWTNFYTSSLKYSRVGQPLPQQKSLSNSARFIKRLGGSGDRGGEVFASAEQLPLNAREMIEAKFYELFEENKR